MNTESTIQELQNKADEVLLAIAVIKAKIASAKAKKIESGEYANPAWFARVNAALKFKQVEHQKLIRETARIKREKNIQNSYEVHRVFVDIAKTRLSNDIFASILNAASEIVELQKRKSA